MQGVQSNMYRQYVYGQLIHSMPRGFEMAEASKWPFQSTSLNSLTCYLSASIVVDGEDQHMASESRSVTDIAFFMTFAYSYQRG